jgi:hypothetical protein
MRFCAATLLAAVSLLLGTTSLCSQGRVLVMPRVDTTNSVIRHIVQTWSDSVYLWRSQGVLSSQHDRTGIPGHAASVVRDWFAQSADVVETFPATIMSVEPSNNNQWVVRTAFSTFDPKTQAVIPFGIMRTIIDVQGTAVTVVNPLQQALETWTTRTVGNISYRMPPGSMPDKRRMRDAADFVERFAQTMDVDVPERITYVVARNRDELCAMLGLEYFAFPPQGLAWPSQSLLMVGNGDVAYAHELVHIVLSSIDVSHPVIREGVATLYGGSLSRPVTTLLAEYRQSRSDTDIPSFTKVFTEPDLAQDDIYILGAAICQQVVARHGVEALRTLLGTASRAETMRLVALWLDIEPGDSMLPLTDVLDAAMASIAETPVTGTTTIDEAK